MSPKRQDPPTNLRSLETRVYNFAQQRGRPVRRIQRGVANTVVGQMLPPGVVKGGTAMNLRVGEASSRFTPDLDATRAASVTLEEYLDQLGERLAVGWDGFTGNVERLDPARPEGVPDDYVMQPFLIRLAYARRHWLTVRFELGHDEIGSTERQEFHVAPDLVELFATLGLDRPDPIPLLAVDHQIAQKIHACTATNPTAGKDQRAHDLVDLQILGQEGPLDMSAIGATSERLFAARRSQQWPPTVVTYEAWDTIYIEASDGLDVLGNVADAVDWANAFIAEVAGGTT